MMKRLYEIERLETTYVNYYNRHGEFEYHVSRLLASHPGWPTECIYQPLTEPAILLT